MTQARQPNPHPLVAPLTEEQQKLVDVVADAFVREDYQWPFFDYVEGTLDDDGLDAVEVLSSFPVIGRWGYGAIAWTRNNSPESEVALTIVGMSHTERLRVHVPVFFHLVDYLVTRRRHAQPRPREVRKLNVTSDEFSDYWLSGRRSGISPRLTAKLTEHDPPTGWGSRGFNPEDGAWTTTVTRQLFRFEGLKTIDEYVRLLEEVIGDSGPVPLPILPSPLSLAAALDYLNAVWRLTHDRGRLFSFASAERTTRLAFDIQTAEEFAAHLSAFADILREADKRLPVEPPRKDRSRALARIEADLRLRLESDAASRAADAIRTLELVIALRDANQHGEASERAVAAHRELHIAYPTTNWRDAWATLSTHALNALNALREELEAVAD